MGDRQAMFVQNIFLLIGILMALGILVVIVIVSWTGIRVWLFTRGQKNEGKDGDAPEGQGEGLLFRERGMCEGCGLYLDKIIKLADGGRLCPSCFEKARKGGGG